MQNYPFVYKVEFWNEVDEKIDHESGIVFGKTFVEAMGKVEGYYGDTLTDIEMFTPLDYDGILPLPNTEMADTIVRADS